MATHTGRSAQWSPSELGDLQSSLSITITPDDKERTRKVAAPALIAHDTPERKTLEFDADVEDLTSDEDTRDLAKNIMYLIISSLLNLLNISCKFCSLWIRKVLCYGCV